MIEPIKNTGNIIYFKSTNSQKKNSAIEQAVKTSKALVDNGYYNTEADYYKFLRSEIDELFMAKSKNDYENMKEEAGDVIFDAIMLANYYGIDPSAALTNTNKKIHNRILLAQNLAQKPLIEYPLEMRLDFWNKAKFIQRQQ